jgi:hypothetical protein
MLKANRQNKTTNGTGQTNFNLFLFKRVGEANKTGPLETAEQTAPESGMLLINELMRIKRRGQGPRNTQKKEGRES